MIKLGINGFGRIGRLVLRALLERQRHGGDRDMQVTAINIPRNREAAALLLKFDSSHGKLDEDIRVDGALLRVDASDIRLYSETNPAQVPWGETGVDIVLECSGAFNQRALAAAHLDGGAKRVLVSAPAKGADITVVYGVNHHAITARHVVVSNASCTTNCLAPVVDVLNQLAGIERGYVTTVHAYTGDQPSLDALHRDPYRARTPATNIVPTSTGAATALKDVIPAMAGRLHGSALRVPVANVSLIDLTAQTERNTSSEEINAAMREASAGTLKSILGYNQLPLVSSDFNHDAHSAVFDAGSTKVIDNNMVRVVAWYDNEWGFSNRMLDTARAMAATIVHEATSMTSQEAVMYARDTLGLGSDYAIAKELTKHSDTPVQTIQISCYRRNKMVMSAKTARLFGQVFGVAITDAFKFRRKTST